MIIVSQSKKCIVNFDSIFGIFAKNNDIYVTFKDNIATILGSYNTKERAVEIIDGISKCYDQEHVRVVIMPEK